MRVAVDQSGQHGFRRKINYVRAAGNHQALTYRLNLVALDENNLVSEDGTGVRIDEGVQRGRR
jgi:hypothetical protein